MVLRSIENKRVKLVGSELKKYRQRKRILNLLYRNGEMSGTEVGKKIGVSLPTALAALNDLVELELVENRGFGESRGGRKPILFGLQKDSLFIVACELGRYEGKMTIYNGNNQPCTPILHFNATIDDTDLVNKISKNAAELIREYKIDEQKVHGIGLTMPGLVDEKTGVNFTIKNKKYQNVKERLENEFGKNVYVNNDARMQAYGEFVFGKAKGYKNALIVNWSWGIGLGMIINGNLFNGANGFAGELSHIKVVEHGNLCVCGKRGCLETVSSAHVLVNAAKNEIRKGTISQLTERFKENLTELAPDDIIGAAKTGDELSISLLNKVGLALGKGLSITIQLFNPDIIVLGGPISRARQYVLTPIQQSLNKYCLEQIYSNTRIEISDSWEHAGLMGVTAMMFQKLFSINK